MPPPDQTRVFDQLQSELRQIMHEARWVLSTLTTGQKRSLKTAIVLMAIAALANAGGPLLIGRIVDAILGGRISSLPKAVPWLARLATLYPFREVVTLRTPLV